MMHKCFFFLLIIAAVSIFAQSERTKVTITSSGFELTVNAPAMQKRISTEGTCRVIDYYEYTRSDAAGNLKIPCDHLIAALPENSKPEIVFSAIRKQVFNNHTLAIQPTLSLGQDGSLVQSDNFSTRNIGRSDFEIVKYFRLGDLYCVEVKIPLAAYDYISNSVEETISYKISFSFQNKVEIQTIPFTAHSPVDRAISDLIANREIAGQFRTAVPFPLNDTTGNWIDYSANYIKIGIAEDRIYRITKTQLDQIIGSVSSINPATIKLYAVGLEIPINVVSQSPTAFVGSDYIEFFGRKNYELRSPRIPNPDSSPYNNYLNRFTDTNYYFLTWDGLSGSRAVIQNSVPQAGLADTLTYYTYFTHYEPNILYQQVTDDLIKSQDPEVQNSKAWFGGYVTLNTAKYSLSLSDIVPGKKASIYCRMSSAASNLSTNAHSLAFGTKIFPNNNADTLMNIVESRSANRFARIVLGGSFPSDSLKPGTNVLMIRNYNNGSEPNYLLFDWYELEHPKVLKAAGDSLYFEIRDSLPLALRNIKIQNVSLPADSLVLYRVKPTIAALTNFIKSGTSLIFSDTVGPGYAYYLLPVKKLTKPPVLKQKKFVNLRSASRKADYIAITHQSLWNAARNYVRFIKNSYSADTALVNIEDIYDEFAYGVPDPASIRAFLSTAHAFWQTPKPLYVVLLGSGCYDYKRYFFKARGYELNTNLVPSFGEPVSDTWYTMWDNSAPFIQKMLIGRLPAKTESDLNYYLTKHQQYLSQRFDDWNKRALFFSGGNGSDSVGLATIQAVQNSIITKYAEPAPLSLSVNHFYKTYKPASDFGPFEPTYIRKAIEAGGAFISYLGHSGTRTWDNSIADPSQLLNRSNKSSLITDFGCSTAKFAEADVESFGGLFVNTGQTIAYIGNTSFGLSGTSLTVPDYFYGKLLRDSIVRISEAHLAAKLKMFTLFGLTGDSRIFSLTNNLLGDPIVKIALPTKPNLSLTGSEISYSNQNPNDQDDSVRVRLPYFNFGLTASDSFYVRIAHRFAKSGKDTSVIILRRVKIPAHSDTLAFTVPVKNLPGDHQLSIELDSGGEINEMYKDDNSAVYKFNVASLLLKIIAFDEFGAQQAPSFKVINSKSLWNTGQPLIIVQYDTTATFGSPIQFSVPPDSFFTKVSFPALVSKKKYWVRIRANTADTLWSNVVPVYKSDQTAPFLIEEKTAFEKLEKSNVFLSGGIRLSKDSMFISVKSGGGNYSKYGSITKNAINQLNTTFGWGMGFAVFDSLTYHVDTAGVFQYGFDNTILLQMSKFVDRLPNGKIMMLCVIDDGYVSGSLRDTLLTTLQKLGSSKIASLSFRQPYILIGRKGAAPGSVPEFKESATYQGILSYDTVLVKNFEQGYLITPKLSGVGKWRELSYNANLYSTSSVKIRPIGVKTTAIVDTLPYLSFSNSTTDLSFLNTLGYSTFQFKTEFASGIDGSSPILNWLALRYDGLPEIDINTIKTKILPDTFYIGTTSNVTICLANVGAAAADSVKIVVTEDPGGIVRDSRIIATIAPEGNIRYSFPVTASPGSANRRLVVNADPDQRLKEYYRENNVYAVPYYIGGDSISTPELNITIDSLHSFDGEFVSNKPAITIQLTDHSLERLDTNWVKNNVGFKIYLDNQQIPYGDPRLTFSFSDANPKITAVLKPTLTEGSHQLGVFALSVTLKDTLIVRRTFSVSETLQLVSVYNYPNPFSEHTNFTFHLSQTPDDLHIKIYTIAGRLVKVLRVNSQDLNPGFNKKVFWDGTDEEGDKLANGVYLYKLIVLKDGKTITKVDKLSIIR